MGIQEDNYDVEHVWSLMNGAGLKVHGPLPEGLGMRVVEKKKKKANCENGQA